MLVYLDQNYASRVSKYLMGQASHEHFGELYRALHDAREAPPRRRPRIPPSPFHVLETRGGYLLPVLQGLFAEFSDGRWVRPWQEVLERQARRHAGPGPALDRRDLLHRGGDWHTAAELGPLEDLLEEPLEGGFFDRCQRLREVLVDRLGLQHEQALTLPYARLLVRLVAFRSLDVDRDPRPSDLIDLVMAATVGPYVDVLATDRYLRETLQRIGYRTPVFSGRRHEVLRLAALVRDGELRPLRRRGAGAGP
ncbi:MAG: hypothetical protein P8Y13_13255 [Deinococcales bacterium]